jgi:RimJ/RimL family protein N-acetyltransferase
MNALASLPAAPVRLRNAAPDDCEQIWSWSYAPELRLRSKRALAVAFAEHARWLTRRLVDGCEPIWVVTEAGAPVGMIRLDASPTGLTQLSITLAAGARGRGIGRDAVAAACRAWGRPLFAELFADNLAGRACLEACGFHSIIDSDGLLTYYWEPEA